jgi:hypothetical protein
MSIREISKELQDLIHIEINNKVKSLQDLSNQHLQFVIEELVKARVEEFIREEANRCLREKIKSFIEPIVENAISNADFTGHLQFLVKKDFFLCVEEQLQEYLQDYSTDIVNDFLQRLEKFSKGD